MGEQEEVVKLLGWLAGGGGSHRCVPEPHGPRAEKAKGSQVLVLGEAREAAAGTRYFAQQSQSISLHILSAVLTPFCQQAEVWSPPLISSYPSCPQSVLNIIRADFFFNDFTFSFICMCICMCIMYVPGAHKRQKTGLGGGDLSMP